MGLGKFDGGGSVGVSHDDWTCNQLRGLAGKEPILPARVQSCLEVGERMRASWSGVASLQGKLWTLVEE